MLKFFLLSLFLFSCKTKHSNSEAKEAPNEFNDPSRANVQKRKYKDTAKSRDLNSLINAGYLWSETYWPLYRGGIANRWQDPAPDDFEDYAKLSGYLYDPYTVEQVKKLTQEELDRLSPAEKFDLWVGDTSFALTRYELNKSINREKKLAIQEWEGMCHGWAPASIYTQTPKSMVSKNSPLLAQNLKINFYPSDIKGLIIKIYAENLAGFKKFNIGLRCLEINPKMENGRVVDERCRDTNPATFHLVLDQYLESQRSLIMDVEEKSQVWNHPVAGYSVKELKVYPAPENANFAKGTVAIVELETTVKYVVGLQEPSKKPELSPMIDESVFKYNLELDGEGYIIGGEWVSMERPDFLWGINDPTSFYTFQLKDTQLKGEKVFELMEEAMR